MSVENETYTDLLAEFLENVALGAPCADAAAVLAEEIVERMRRNEEAPSGIYEARDELLFADDNDSAK